MYILVLVVHLDKAHNWSDARQLCENSTSQMIEIKTEAQFLEASALYDEYGHFGSRLGALEAAILGSGFGSMMILRCWLIWRGFG